MPLINEAVRGEGAVLVDERGRRFLAEAPGCELAPRDVVARGPRARCRVAQAYQLPNHVSDAGTRPFDGRADIAGSGCFGLDDAVLIKDNHIAPAAAPITGVQTILALWSRTTSTIAADPWGIFPAWQRPEEWMPTRRLKMRHVRDLARQECDIHRHICRVRNTAHPVPFPLSFQAIEQYRDYFPSSLAAAAGMIFEAP